jgi:hypothetical protein
MEQLDGHVRRLQSINQCLLELDATTAGSINFFLQVRYVAPIGACSDVVAVAENYNRR